MSIKSFINKFFYTLLALSISFFIYAVNKGITLDRLFDKVGLETCATWFKDNVPGFVSFILYLIILIGLALLSQLGIKKLISIDISKDSIKTIEPASEGMMLTYIGLFFFALSVSNIQAFLVLFFILFVCVLFTNVYMFSPLFSLILFHFYYITFHSGKKCLLITRERFEFGDTITISKIYKLNEFTFIDYGLPVS